MDRTVVDTSALIDSADDDHPDWGASIFRLLADHEVRAPALLASEAGNVVHHKHPDVFGTDPEERAAFLEDLLEGVTLVPSTPGARHRLAHLVASTGLTYYDAEFLELAERADDTLLVSHDRTLREAGRELLGEDRALDLGAVHRRLADGRL